MPSPTHGAWPASTGWLIVSILFANKLWISDASSMSLFWVARLPIKRPEGQARRISSRTSRRGTEHVPLADGRGRLWKIALSLAIVGALAAPFAFRTYKARLTYPTFVRLTVQEREKLAAILQDPNYCKSNDVICPEKGRYLLGGYYESYPHWVEYLTLKLSVAAATFAGVFGVALLIPMLVGGGNFLMRRYWKWLSA